MNKYGDPEIKRIMDDGDFVEDEFGFFWRRLAGHERRRLGDGVEFKNKIDHVAGKYFRDLQLVVDDAGTRADSYSHTYVYRKLDPLVYHMMRAKEKHAKAKSKA